jgi:hypothetical protein
MYNLHSKIPYLYLKWLRVVPCVVPQSMGHVDHQEAHLFQSILDERKNTTYGVQKVEEGR